MTHLSKPIEENHGYLYTCLFRNWWSSLGFSDVTDDERKHAQNSAHWCTKNHKKILTHEKQNMPLLLVLITL